MFTTSEAGKVLIQSFEQCRLKAYPDPATGDAPWTCGWGCTGPDIGRGTTWTQQQADDRFAAELSKFEAAVNGMVTGPINQHMFDALVSFAYNCGAANLRGSTLLKKVNAGDFAGSALEFAKWIRADGSVMNGLIRRRKAEAELFLKPYA